MRSFSFGKDNLGTLLMTGYPIYSVKKIKFENVYVPHPADVSGQKLSALIRHPYTCGSSVNNISLGYKWYPKIRNFDLQKK